MRKASNIKDKDQTKLIGKKKKKHFVGNREYAERRKQKSKLKDTQRDKLHPQNKYRMLYK